MADASIEPDEYSSPEEAALSVREEAPGATDHEDPHPAYGPDDVSEPGSTRGLLAQEDRLWTELHTLVDSLPRDRVDEPGYFAEGWSAKDLVGHIGSWLAEAGLVLEQIRFGTYRPEEIDVDAMNETFYEDMRDTTFADVHEQGIAARSRMLRAWRALPEASPEAERWIAKAGPKHYSEHLRRLRDWVAEVDGSPIEES